MDRPEIWNNPEQAQSLGRERAQLDNVVGTLERVSQTLSDNAEMLEMAEIKPGDVVYDLGCGDGRIVVTAAKRYGCRAVGYDLDRLRVHVAPVHDDQVLDAVGDAHEAVSVHLADVAGPQPAVAEGRLAQVGLEHREHGAALLVGDRVEGVGDGGVMVDGLADLAGAGQAVELHRGDRFGDGLDVMAAIRFEEAEHGRLPASGDRVLALSFDGTDDYVDTGVWDVHGNTISISAWIKATGPGAICAWGSNMITRLPGACTKLVAGNSSAKMLRTTPQTISR